MHTTWNETLFEKELFKKIKKDKKLLQGESDKLIRRWNNAKDFLIPHVLEEIKASEPNLSDHGPRHIANVLDNAYYLLHVETEPSSSTNPQKPFNNLSSHEAYVLGFSIMYHDVGNIFGRDKHNQRIQEIFTKGFTEYDLDSDLRQVINDIACAHTGGKDSSGKSLDTLSALDARGLWNNKTIRSQQLAAILRFADELAEGPQRASILRLRNDLPFSEDTQIADESRIFHECAKWMSIQIDRTGSRIVVKLTVDIADYDTVNQEADVKSILNMFWHRVDILNQERKYARHYTSLLEPFKTVNIQVMFFNKCSALPVTRQQSFNDLVVPQKPDIVSNCNGYPQLDSGTIWEDLRNCMEVSSNAN